METVCAYIYAKKQSVLLATIEKYVGTLEPEEAQESMFTDEFQRFEQMEYSPEAIDLLYDLMGTDIIPRRDFIFNNVDFTEVAE